MIRTKVSILGADTYRCPVRLRSFLWDTSVIFGTLLGYMHYWYLSNSCTGLRKLSAGRNVLKEKLGPNVTWQILMFRCIEVDR